MLSPGGLSFSRCNKGGMPLRKHIKQQCQRIARSCLDRNHKSRCRSSVFFGEVLNSTLLLTFILFWTLSHNYIHLF